MKTAFLICGMALLACPTMSAQRLPEGATPSHYDLTFNINFPTNSFEGEESIDLKLAKPSNAITLNALEIGFHEVTVSAAGQTQTARIATDASNETATFTVDQPIPAGAAKLHIRYTGHLNDKLRGLYLSTYNGRKYAVTQMEATDARVAFPSFDEPAYKATFDITAVVDKGDTAISNNEIISDKPGPGAKHTIQFATSPKMSSYLVALTVGDWKCAHDEVDGIKLGVCTVPGKENLTRFPLDATKAILHYYNNYYGIRYPLKKLDQIAVPDFQAGAMENWGAVIYRETALLVDDKTGSFGAKSNVAGVIAHEVAHQWFGDLVTMSWWDDVWLNEGFATWMTPHPIAAWKPDWLVSQDVVETSQNALATDGVRNTRPIHQEANTRGEIQSLFDGIAYGKTASVLHMLESYLGAEAFRAGVNLYLKEHAYGNATASDFWNAMARSSGKPVDQIMPTFVMQAGVPYVEVAARCEAGNTTLNVSQKRYFNNTEEFLAANDQLWQIPLCAKPVSAAGTGPSQCFLMTKRHEPFTMKGCSKFAYPHAGALGYYRFGYDAAGLKQLGDAAAKGLTPDERIALVGNEWALMRAGKANVGDYLALGAQFKNTVGYMLLENFVSHLEFIHDNLLNQADRSEFQNWLRQTFSPMLQQLGYSARPGDLPTDRQKRAILFNMLGNLADDPQVVQQAGSLAQDYMKDPHSIDSTLARAVVNVAARHGDAALYAKYKTQMKSAQSPEQYYRYFRALGEFQQPELTQQTLASALTSEVRGQDLYMLSGMMDNSAAQDAVWNFMQQNYDVLNAKTGGGLGGFGIFLGAVHGFCSQEKAQEVEKFFQEHPIQGTERNQAEALEGIRSCVTLRNQQQTTLAAWLRQNVPASASAGSQGSSAASTQ
jgi:aminopeptidase N/puromycin-sensitive aminopeptidase